MVQNRVGVYRKSRVLWADECYWTGRNGLTQNHGMELWTMEINGTEYVYIDFLGSRGLINGGGKIEATLMDELCKKWLEVRKPQKEDGDLVVERDGIRVEWVDLGEGWSGDWDEDDPDDEPLLRFDVYIHKDRLEELVGYNAEPCFSEGYEGWYSPQDSSYCTRMNANAPRDVLIEALEAIWASVDHEGCGKNLEHMSWICAEWVYEWREKEVNNG